MAQFKNYMQLTKTDTEEIWNLNSPVSVFKTIHNLKISHKDNYRPRSFHGNLYPFKEKIRPILTKSSREQKREYSPIRFTNLAQPDRNIKRNKFTSQFHEGGSKNLPMMMNIGSSGHGGGIGRNTLLPCTAKTRIPPRTSRIANYMELQQPRS